MAGVPTLFRSVVKDGFGNLKHDSGFRPNLRTNAGADQQSLAMGGSAGFTGISTTAPSATTYTLDGQAGTLNQFRGQWIVAYGASGTLVAAARILSNTAATPAVLTVEAWIKGDGTAATTPVAGTWHILPGGLSAPFLALSSTVQSGNVADVTLAGEFTVAGGTGLDRKLGTWAHTTAATSYTLNKLFTAAGAGGTVNSEAVFATALQASPSGQGIMFESAEPTPPAMIAGDTLNQTVTVNF